VSGYCTTGVSQILPRPTPVAMTAKFQYKISSNSTFTTDHIEILASNRGVLGSDN